MGEPTSIKALLLKLSRHSPWKVLVKDPQIWRAWDLVVGETIARNAQPHSFRRRVLWVRCSGPQWMHQLQLMKEMLRERLNAELGGQRVRDLRFLLGEVKGEPEGGEPEEIPQGTEEVLAPLEDEELRQIVRRILAKVRRGGPKSTSV